MKNPRLLAKHKFLRYSYCGEINPKHTIIHLLVFHLRSSRSTPPRILSIMGNVTGIVDSTFMYFTISTITTRVYQIEPLYQFRLEKRENILFNYAGVALPARQWRVKTNSGELKLYVISPVWRVKFIV